MSKLDANDHVLHGEFADHLVDLPSALAVLEQELGTYLTHSCGWRLVRAPRLARLALCTAAVVWTAIAHWGQPGTFPVRHEVTVACMKVYAALVASAAVVYGVAERGGRWRAWRPCGNGAERLELGARLRARCAPHFVLEGRARTGGQWRVLRKEDTLTQYFTRDGCLLRPQLHAEMRRWAPEWFTPDSDR
ncbi:hypothetical protein CDCA_CDCA03G0965 [Cyanidium caldarium]|uniref:Uncharacterized protein n=1 Tax=Cyanidium caldarium TaxID=2771 RepID=A0AAV9IS74_CYACA|nr:hypothetical protein CDCA_CDCA03G0965 [Cyanidium caldarium]